MLLPIRFKKVIVAHFDFDYADIKSNTKLRELKPGGDPEEILVDLTYLIAETYANEDIKELIFKDDIYRLGDLHKYIVEDYDIAPEKSELMLSMANTSYWKKQQALAVSFLSDVLASKCELWKKELIQKVSSGYTNMSLTLFAENFTDLFFVNTIEESVCLVIFIPSFQEDKEWLLRVDKYGKYLHEIHQAISQDDEELRDYSMSLHLACNNDIRPTKALLERAEKQDIYISSIKALQLPTSNCTSYSELEFSRISGLMSHIDLHYKAPTETVQVEEFDIISLAPPALVKFLEKGQQLKNTHPTAAEIFKMSLNTVLLSDNEDMAINWACKLQESMFSEGLTISHLDFSTIENTEALHAALDTKGIVYITNIEAHKEVSFSNQSPQSELLKKLAKEVSQHKKALFLLVLPANNWKQIQAVVPMLRVCFQYEFETMPLSGTHLNEEVKRLVKQSGFELSMQAQILASEYLSYMCDTLPPADSTFTIAQMLANEILYYHRTSEESLESEISRARVVDAIRDEYATSNERSLPVIMTELNRLVGLKQVKEDIKTIAAMVKVSAIRQQSNTNISLNTIFLGNPGTGKTTVAKLLGQVYKNIGVLSKGHVVCTTRSEIVERWIGYTAKNMKGLIDRARGGILLIDEAYALYQPNNEKDFGHEAIDTLVAELETIKEHTCVILAGYPKPMSNFLNANVGLASRFPNKITFEDYNLEELYSILVKFIESEHYTLATEAIPKTKHILEQVLATKNEHFGNARTCRNLFEQLKLIHANRLFDMESPTQEQLNTIINDDVQSLQKQLAVKATEPIRRIGYFSQKQ